MPELKAPRESTIRKLFALSSNRCAFPQCQTAIVDPDTGTILGEVCHICAQKAGGPRFNAGQTSDDRHSLQNLVLMCGVHHKFIDAEENLSIYSPQRLIEIKASHEARAQPSESETLLTAGIVEELLKTIRDSSTSMPSMDFRGAFFNAGGFGGGPSGGGGGGGVIHVVGMTPAGLREKVDLDGKPGAFPGGGGGGGGVMTFSGRLASSEDLEKGLKVSAFLFTNSVEVRSGLLYLMGGGWENCTCSSLPQDLSINMAAVVETGTILPNTLLALAIVVKDPSGNVVTSDSFELGVSEVMRPIMRQCVARNVHLHVTEAGVWSFLLRSGDVELASMNLEFRLNV